MQGNRVERVTAWAAAVLLFTAGGARAQQAVGGGVTIHGFGGWAAGYADNANNFAQIATKDLAVDNYSFALKVDAQPKETLTLLTQVEWEHNQWGEELKIDHLVAKWNFVAPLTLNAGKIKNPLGVYTDIFDVGTLRPFYLLPQGLYADVPEGYVGVGLNGRHKLGRWEVEADLIGGQMEFRETREEVPMVDPSTGVPVVNPGTGMPVWASLAVDSQGRDFVGGGFVVRPPIEGLELGSSAYSINLWTSVLGSAWARSGEKRTNVVAATGELVRERLILRAEGMRVTGDSRINAFFVEGAYKLTDRWQAALSFDWRERMQPPPPVATLGDHRSVGLALNYWVHPTVVFKLNYYNITGNRLARPESAVDLALAGQLEKKTNVVVVGTQFSF